MEAFVMVCFMEEAAPLYTEEDTLFPTMCDRAAAENKQVCLFKRSCFPNRKRCWDDLTVMDNRQNMSRTMEKVNHLRKICRQQ